MTAPEPVPRNRECGEFDSPLDDPFGSTPRCQVNDCVTGERLKTIGEFTELELCSILGQSFAVERGRFRVTIDICDFVDISGQAPPG